jgi:glyoxylase-like metal-dependent hydrolase (beta-lactamase superfamily II)
VKEIATGLHHWTAFHEAIKFDVSSYYVTDARALIDPMVPPEGIDSLPGDDPQVILLTNRHHYRKSAAFVEAFGCPVLCHEAGLHEFENGPDVKGFSFGDEIAPGIVALEMDAICPEDTVLRIDVAQGALAFADSLIHYGGNVGFVPDQFMDDPDEVKRGVRKVVRRLLDEEFDIALFAHGDPIAGGAKDALRGFLAR